MTKSVDEPNEVTATDELCRMRMTKDSRHFAMRSRAFRKAGLGAVERYHSLPVHQPAVPPPIGWIVVAKFIGW